MAGPGWLPGAMVPCLGMRESRLRITARAVLLLLALQPGLSLLLDHEPRNRHLHRLAWPCEPHGWRDSGRKEPMCVDFSSLGLDAR